MRIRRIGLQVGELLPDRRVSGTVVVVFPDIHTLRVSRILHCLHTINAVYCTAVIIAVVMAAMNVFMKMYSICQSQIHLSSALAGARWPASRSLRLARSCLQRASSD
jgi:hypothetical protein